MKSYKDLMVYQKSYEQGKRIHALTKNFPKEELYALTNQIRRAAISIPLNIAEGYGKTETGKEVLRFLSMARGSSAEMEVLLEYAKDFGYITESEYHEAIREQNEVGRMLTGLIRSLRAKDQN